MICGCLLVTDLSCLLVTAMLSRDCRWNGMEQGQTNAAEGRRALSRRGKARAHTHAANYVCGGGWIEKHRLSSNEDQRGDLFETENQVCRLDLVADFPGRSFDAMPAFAPVVFFSSMRVLL